MAAQRTHVASQFWKMEARDQGANRGGFWRVLASWPPGVRTAGFQLIPHRDSQRTCRGRQQALVSHSLSRKTQGRPAQAATPTTSLTFDLQHMRRRPVALGVRSSTCGFVGGQHKPSIHGLSYGAGTLHRFPVAWLGVNAVMVCSVDRVPEAGMTS